MEQIDEFEFPDKPSSEEENSEDSESEDDEHKSNKK